MDFPASRFRAAGASAQEIEQLSEAFARSPQAAQQSYLDHVQSVSNYDLAQQLASTRAAVKEPADAEEPAAVDEPAEEEPAAPVPTSRAGSAGPTDADTGTPAPADGKGTGKP